MALSRVKVWSAEVLTASDLNAEFDNIINNGTSLISPLGGALDWDGYAHTLDAAGVTTAQSTSAIAWTFIPGSKTGTPGTTGGISNWAASTWTDNNTAGSGTATAWTGHSFQRPTLAATNSSVTTTDAATVYIANSPLAGSNETLTNAWSLWVDSGAVRLDGDLTMNGNLRANAAFGGHIQGLTYANSSGDATNDIDIAIGMATSGDAAQTNRRTMTLASALTKQLDAAWAVGTNAGGLDGGSIANTDYFIWLIMRSDTGVVDALFSTSATSPTMPTNYDYKRLIGWFRRTGGTIVTFKTYEVAGGGLDYVWVTPINDVAIANTLTTSRRLDALSVPVGLSVLANIRSIADDAGAVCLVLIQNPDETDAAPSGTTTPGITYRSDVVGAVGPYEGTVRTNTSAQVASRANITVDAYDIITLGFKWSRR